MKKRPKPRGPWESVVSIPPETLKEEDYQAITEKLKIALDHELIKQVIHAQQYYYSGIRLFNEEPRMSEICATMKMLIKQGKKWVAVLEKLDDRSLEKLQAVCSNDIFPGDISLIWDRMERALSDAIIICGRGEAALDAWQCHKKQKNTGAPFDFPLRSYISQLAKIYEKATGLKATINKDPYAGEINQHSQKIRERYSGKFFNFAYACHKKIPGRPPLSNSAFGSAIQRALKHPTISYSG